MMFKEDDGNGESIAHKLDGGNAAGNEGQQSQSQQQQEDEDGISQRSHYSHRSQHSGISNRSVQSHQSVQSAQSQHSHQSQHSGGGECFFADMTLDLDEAHLEATPRSELKFAHMAKNGNSNATAAAAAAIMVNGRMEEGRAIPPLPVLDGGGGGGIDGIDGGGTNATTTTTTSSAAAAAAATPSVVHNGNTAAATTVTTITEAAASSSTSPLEIEPRSFTRISGGSIHNNNTISNNTTNNTNNSNNSNYINSSSHSSNNNLSRLASQRPRPPRGPRDVSWTVAAMVIMPMGLILPHLYYSVAFIEKHNNHCSVHITSTNDDADGTTGGDDIGGHDIDCIPLRPSWSQTALYSASHHTIFFSSLLSSIISILLLRLLYSSPGGGDGDDVRHATITRTLLLSSNLSVLINPLLVLMIWYWLPKAKHVVLLPLGLMMRDVYRARKTGSALPSFRGRGFGGGGGGRSQQQQQQQQPQRGGGGTSASSSHDRKTFFRALACAALDILSRSLRRKSFVRVASVVMVVQFICVTLWWSAVRVVLTVQIFENDGIVTKFMHAVWLLVAFVAGKWATGTIARVLGFVASGGVASWFAQQTMVIEEMRAREREAEEMEQQRKAPKCQVSEDGSSKNGNGTGDAADNSSAVTGYDSNFAAARAARHAMPEAYRTADADAYAPVMEFDEGLDDDYEEEGESDQRHERTTRITSGGMDAYSMGGGGGASSMGQNPSTVKSFLMAALTISFGSVAQCGLLGGLAQFLWSVVRNMDAMGFFISSRFARNSSGFRGMDISVDSAVSGGLSNPRQWRQKIAFYWRKMDVAIRVFVRGHSDLAMSHVAAYYKSYQRAANDVAALIETSGVEPIIHDDITTHMCSSVCTLISGSIVIFFGMLLTTHRNITTSSVIGGYNNSLTDTSLLEVLFFAYIICYTLVFTALEPLRAAIKAVYVCFAEHPMSLSQAFPLIYQRLSRISEASGN